MHADIFYAPLPDAPHIYRLQVGQPVYLPLALSRLPAGFPSPADDHLEKRLDLNEFLIGKKAACFVWQIDPAGDSMIDLGYMPGDFLVIDRSITARHKSLVLAVINGEQTFKQYYCQGGKTMLISHNRERGYSPLVIREGDEFSIWGVLYTSFRKSGF